MYTIVRRFVLTALTVGGLIAGSSFTAHAVISYNHCQARLSRQPG